MISNEEFNQDNPNPFLITESIFRIEAVKNLLSEAYPNQSNPDYDFLINLQDFMQMHQDYWSKIPGGIFKHSKLVEKLAYKEDVTLENYQAYINFLKEILRLTVSQDSFNNINQPHQKKKNWRYCLNTLGIIAILGCLVLTPPLWITLGISISGIGLLLLAQYLKKMTQYQHDIIEEMQNLSSTDDEVKPTAFTSEA